MFKAPLSGGKRKTTFHLLRRWIVHFMGLNLSNRQIAQELDIIKDDAQKMTSQLRESIFSNSPISVLKVECTGLIKDRLGIPLGLTAVGDLLH